MRTLYRTAFWIDNDSHQLVTRLRELGFDLAQGKFEAVEFYDDDKNFNEIKALFEQHNRFLSKYSKYTESERLASRFLGIGGDWHNGYPQPEDDYIEICYSIDSYCSTCGIGKRQKKPLRIKNEPKWGRRSIFQLNWIFDEYFIKPDLYNKIFLPRGLQYKDVIHHKKDIVLQNVLQLNIPTVDSDLVMDNYPFEICGQCKRKKYLPITIGGYPIPKHQTNLAMFKSREFFGSGASASKYVFIDSLLYKDLKSNNIKGIGYHPVFEK